MGSHSPRSRLWTAYWIVVALLVASHAAHAVFDLGGEAMDRFFEDWVYTALYFSPLPAVVYRVLTNRSERAAWVVLGVGLASYDLSTVIYSVFFANEASPPFPSVSDAMWLLLYPCSLVAILMLVSARLYRVSRILLLDGVVSALTASALLSAVAMSGLMLRGGALERIVTLAYPLSDLILLSIVVTVFAAMAWRPDRFWALLGTGFLIMVVADTFYVTESTAGTYQQGGLLDTSWPLAMLLIGLAARRPQKVEAPRTFGVRTLLVPGVAGAVLVALEVTRDTLGMGGTSEILGVLALGALILRLLVSLVQVQRLAASHEQARTDPLSGLLNRRGFDEQLAAEAARSTRLGSPLAIAVFDLDRFKHLNDRFGHAEGDLALRRFAGLLRACTRQIDTVARLGGEEFVLLAPSTSEEGALQVAERIRLEVEKEFAADLALTVSCGIAGFPGRAEEVEDALQAADDALYAAKRSGRNRCLVYRDSDMRRARRRARPRDGGQDANEVAALLERPDSIVPQFQPIVALTTGHIAGYEALARFPGREPRPPDAWFAQARACGLGAELEAHALRAALACPGRPSGHFLTLNVSPSALRSPEVRSALPGDLTEVILELTEHEVIASDPVLEDALAELRERGARIALDDVGSAYSGLHSVVSVAPDIIKIDRDLTSGVHRDPAKSALIESFVSFAHRTGAAVCAEGVEELDEAVFLADLDVLYGQGYALSRPAAPWATISPAVSQELLRRSLNGDTDLDNAPDTGDRRLELVVARLSAVRSRAELDAVAPLIAKELNADEAVVSIWNAVADYVESLTGSDAGNRYWSVDFPRTSHALRTNEAVQVVLGESGADEAEVAFLQGQGYSSLLMVPVVHGGATIGLLEAMSTASTPWSRTSINRARIIAYQLGAVLAALLDRPAAAPLSPAHG